MTDILTIHNVNSIIIYCTLLISVISFKIITKKYLMISMFQANFSVSTL